METSFISGLLLIFILAIFGLYLYQSTPSIHAGKSSNSGKDKNGKEAFFPVIFDTCPLVRKQGTPVHRVGPVYNFHQHFNKYSPLMTCSKSAANIPQVEMEWRNLYISQYSQNQVPLDDQFAGTSIRNYLNNMENVDNIYRKCL